MCKTLMITVFWHGETSWDSLISNIFLGWTRYMIDASVAGAVLMHLRWFRFLLRHLLPLPRFPLNQLNLSDAVRGSGWPCIKLQYPPSFLTPFHRTPSSHATCGHSTLTKECIEQSVVYLWKAKSDPEVSGTVKTIIKIEDALRIYRSISARITIL